uniref:Ig-like domain-containing protein n=1 Tax=Cyanistes caeruleus TaxID=156563 RepID=A0A8C0USB4_CYACU
WESWRAMLAVVLALLSGERQQICLQQGSHPGHAGAGDSLNISCRSNRAYMFWYQQPPRNGLKLIVSSSTWSSNSYEHGYSEAKFEITRESSFYALMTIKNLTSKDEATYFCAASDRTV